ncbi:MAG: hypothetical protein N3D85_05530 [Candidatus Bathyarchaeota archaeon]|nr:hypothetical protein [Candidatus Bathyarchaeota archaeon]
MTITLDDAGSGDLLFGVVIGAYRNETQEFTYEIIDVKFFQQDLFKKKEYLNETSKVVCKLLNRLELKPDEEIHVCQGYIFDKAVEELRKQHGDSRVHRVKVVGEPQRLVEIAYLDEIRNLGYEPLPEREEKRAKNFFHMMRWLKTKPEMIKYAKTGWPRLARYRMFNNGKKKHKKITYRVICAVCGNKCVVPFKPAKNRSVYCRNCWTKQKSPT